MNAYAKGLGRGENPIFPNVIFRVKRGINLDKGDPNYDLFQLAISVAAKRLNPTFSFMDTSFNKPYGGDVAYMAAVHVLLLIVAGLKLQKAAVICPSLQLICRVWQLSLSAT